MSHWQLDTTLAATENSRVRSMVTAASVAHRTPIDCLWLGMWFGLCTRAASGGCCGLVLLLHPPVVLLRRSLPPPPRRVSCCLRCRGNNHWSGRCPSRAILLPTMTTAMTSDDGNGGGGGGEHIQSHRKTDHNSSKLVVVIAGPTGSGKSDVAAHICAARNGMVVSADSVQAYRKVQIGANKPNAAERAQTPHILVDVADHTQNYNAATWRRDAIYVIQKLLSISPMTNYDVVEAEEVLSSPASELERRQTITNDIRNAVEAKKATCDANCDGPTTPFLPVVVGGTMMYLQWLVHGRPDAMRPTENALALAKEQMSRYELLKNWDGATDHVRSQGEILARQVQKLSKNDWYRLRRILEVAYTVKEKQDDSLIDKLYSGLLEGSLSSLGYDVRCFFLCPDDRMKHTKVVDRRCEEMICRGLLKETADLVLLGEMPEMASRAIGYRQSLDYLERENPKDNDDEAFAEYLAQFTTATRQYAKRQMQWFRRDDDFVFVSVPLSEDKSKRVHAVADEIASLLALSRESYDELRLSPTSPSSTARRKNEEQGKGMKVYQFETQILKQESLELRAAIADADHCTHRIQANMPRHDVQIPLHVL